MGIVFFMLTVPFSGSVSEDMPVRKASKLKSTGNILSNEGETGLHDWNYYSMELINIWSGNLFLSQSDISVPAKSFDIELVRSYNSFHRDSSGAFGRGWRHNYELTLIQNTDGSVVFVERDGSTANYSSLGDGNYVTPPGTRSRLNNDGTNYTLRKADGSVVTFDNSGTLRMIDDKNGNQLSFHYGAYGLETVEDVTLTRPDTFT